MLSFIFPHKSQISPMFSHTVFFTPTQVYDMYPHSLGLAMPLHTLLPLSISTVLTSFAPSQKDLTLQNTEIALTWGCSVHFCQGLSTMHGISPRSRYKRNIIKINNKMEEILFMKQNCVNFTGLLSNEIISKLMFVWCPPWFLAGENLYPDILTHQLYVLPFIFCICISSEKGANSQSWMRSYIILCLMKLALPMYITTPTWSDQVHVTLTSRIRKLPHLNVCQLCFLTSKEILKKIYICL